MQLHLCNTTPLVVTYAIYTQAMHFRLVLGLDACKPWTPNVKDPLEALLVLRENMEMVHVQIKKRFQKKVAIGTTSWQKRWLRLSLRPLLPLLTTSLATTGACGLALLSFSEMGLAQKVHRRDHHVSLINNHYSICRCSFSGASQVHHSTLVWAAAKCSSQFYCCHFKAKRK